MKVFLSVVALLSSAACAGAEIKNVDRTVPLAAHGSITLETHNGSVDVRTWDRPQIEIHARIESASTLPDDLRRFDDTTVEVTSSPDSVSIVSTYPAIVWSWFGQSPTIYYTITAPKTARWTVRDHNAHIDMRDVSATVNVDSHNGSLRVVNLAGSLEVRSHNGSVSADFAAFHGATISTFNGMADLTLPASSQFDLSANSRHRQIESDFPVLIRTISHRFEGVEGRVNGGGAALHFTSHNGQLRLRARQEAPVGGLQQ
jgi:hypothetical protein